MSWFSAPRTIRTILLVLLVQLCLILGSCLFVWFVLGRYEGNWSQVAKLSWITTMLLLAVGISIVLGVRWCRRAEPRLLEAHDRFKHLVDSIDGIVWEMDLVAEVNTFVSHKAEHMLGYRVEDWYSDSLFWRKHLHPDDREKTIETFRKAEINLLPFTVDYRMTKQDGGVVWIRDIATVTAVDGRPSRLQGVMLDITERRRLQEELEQALQEAKAREADLNIYKDHLEELVMARSKALERTNTELRIAWEKAEESNRMKSNFLANMSHELRTPLNAIILYSDLVRDETESLGQKEISDDLHNIQSAGRHLLSLIDDILDMSKIEAGRITLNMDEINVCEMLHEITANTAPMIGKNHNHLIVQADPDVQSLQTDQTRLRQILINLLSNASKFTSDGTITLGIQAWEDPGQILFYVRDTGIGMTSEQLGRIFQNFTQADDTTTRKFGGTGLGLALSKRLAELLGGALWAESEEGKGSVFYLKMPRQMQIADSPELAQT